MNSRLLSGTARLAALALAYFFLVLAVIGIVLPGLPTVPFLLLAAWFAARGSERLHRWIYSHPHLGKLLIDWEQQGAISVRSKRIAIFMLLVSWVIMLWRLSNPWLMAAITLTLLLSGTYIMTRPEPC